LEEPSRREYSHPTSGLSQPYNLPELQSIAQLSDAQSGHHVTVRARLVSFGFEQIRDQMGEKTILRGTIEDHSLRTPLRSHRIFTDLERGRVYSFSNAYVHEFPDSSLSLVLTERSRVKEVEVSREDVPRYVWKPKIGELRRPNWNIVLSGFVTRINPSTSGLVRRCNSCKQIIYDSCPRNCSSGWSWDFRISCDLTDRTGSIRMVLARYLASRVVGRSVSEILFAASSPGEGIEPAKSASHQRIEGIGYVLKPRGEIEVVEIPAERYYSSDTRFSSSPFSSSADSLAVVDGFNVVYPVNGGSDQEVAPDVVNSEVSPRRKLDWKNDPQDARILRKLIVKSIELRARELYKSSMTSANGILPVDDPMELFRTERAKLYQGFKVSVQSRGEDILVEASPRCSVLESVWDYANWRRGMGATARSIEATLKERRFSVVVAPAGRMGTIKNVLWDLAGRTKVSGSDRRTLVEYWSDVYGIEVDPEEIPLVQVQPMESRSTACFTYPPSQVYFDERVLPISTSLRKFITRKSLGLTKKVRDVMEGALSDLVIGDCKLEVNNSDTTPSSSNSSVDLRGALFGEIRERLMGMEIRARGEVTKLGDTLYFLPNTIFSAFDDGDDNDEGPAGR